MTQTPVDEGKASDQAAETSAVNDVPPAPVPPRASGQKSGLILSVVALVLAGGAVAFSAVNWKNFSALRASVGERVQATETQASQLRQLGSDTATQLNAAQARVSALEQRVSELNLQRTQLEELMLSVSRSRDDTLVQDLIASLRFATQQSQIIGTTQPSIAALQAGIDRIEGAANPRLSGVRDAMRRDLEQLQGAENSDVSVIVRQLAQLAGAVDTLVMRDTAPPPRVMTGAGKDGDPAVSDASSPAPQNTSTPSGLLARIRGSASEAWTQFLQFAQSQTQDLIRIRVAQPTDELMVTPEAAVLVKANLRLQLLTARVALLTGQKATASADIAAVLASITRLTDPMAAPVQATVDGLQKAQAAIAALYVPTPQASLAALNALAVATPVR